MLENGGDGIKVRAILDFDPKQMNSKEKSELEDILQLHKRRRKTMNNEEEPIVKRLRRQEYPLNAEESDQRKKRKTLKEGRDFHMVEDAKEEAPNQYKETQKEEETIRAKALEMALPSQERISDQGDVGEKSGSDDSSGSEDDVDSELQDQRSPSIKSVDSYSSDESLDPYVEALTFKRGDKMETFTSANFGDSDGWWRVRHLCSGQIGFIPKNRVVIDFGAEDQPVKTTPTTSFLGRQALRSSTRHQLLVPRCRTSLRQHRALSCIGLVLWKSLPPDICGLPLITKQEIF